MQGEGVNNFGDVLTPKLFDYFSIRYVHDNTNFNTISIGSIGNKANDKCIVLGSGTAWENVKLNPNAEWVFVRGPLTRESVIKSGGKCPEIFGDPALLLPIFCDESNKEFDLGIIPHYKEYEMVKKMYPNEKVINLNNPNPLEVAKEITKCRMTISSSLHGIICSHAYNIPCAWVKFSDKIIGDDTKFKDHYKSIDLDCKLSSFNNPIFTNKYVNTNKLVDIFKSL